MKEYQFWLAMSMIEIIGANTSAPDSLPKVVWTVAALLSAVVSIVCKVFPER